MASQLWICWQNHTLVKEGLSWSDACEGCTSLFIHDSNPQEWGSPGLQDMWGLVKIECPNLGWFADESKYALPWAWVVLTALFAIIFIIFYLYYPLTPSKKKKPSTHGSTTGSASSRTLARRSSSSRTSLVQLGYQPTWYEQNGIWWTFQEEWNINGI